MVGFLFAFFIFLLGVGCILLGLDILLQAIPKLKQKFISKDFSLQNIITDLVDAVFGLIFEIFGFMVLCLSVLG